MSKFSIAYFTNRRDCRIEWFWSSLMRQGGAGIPVIVVDFYQDERDVSKYPWNEICNQSKHIEPKPYVWSGKHRLTSRNYFSAASFRNTAIIVCQTEYLVFVDDISVLLPGWLDAVKRAVEFPGITLGAYKKVKNLIVEHGEVKSFEPFPPGVDSRWNHGSDTDTVIASGSWLFGCSFAAPLEALLKVNGSDENSDPSGGEDYTLGIRLQNAGYSFRYDRRMLTYESEELHHIEPPFLRIDPGQSPRDRSHALLHLAMGSNYAANFFGDGGIRAVRERVLAGEPMPIIKIPQHDFFTGKPLSEM